MLVEKTGIFIGMYGELCKAILNGVTKGQFHYCYYSLGHKGFGYKYEEERFSHILLV